MRLEKIILDGFKSFADKTELEFNSDVTAIVGPNGCGKSNVVDAVKWVLGEQSVKSLRSGQMADVIFSGSASRKPSGTAEVSLLLSNTTGTLPIEAEQVQISRRIYKSGESEYRINNNICRLKDIRELFMDTGIGVKSYSIIEQGQVEQLLTASKTDRRTIFEEAAGISKYRVHKKEAMRKLERTEQNMLRLADILAEVQKQLRSIKLAAGKARNYLHYKDRLKQLEVNYSLAEYDRLYRQTNQKKEAVADVQGQFASVSAEVARYDSSLSTIGQQIIELDGRINETDNSLVTAGSNIEHRLQRIELLTSRLKEINERLRSSRQRYVNLREQQKSLKSELEGAESERQNCEESFEQKNKGITELREQIKQISGECDGIDAELEDEKSGIIDIVRRTAQLHNEVQSTTVNRDNFSMQKKRLSGRVETTDAELQQLFADKAKYQSRLSDIAEVLDELQKNIILRRKEAELVNGQIEENKRKTANIKENRSAVSRELSILTQMAGEREGLTEAVKNILEKKASGDSGFDCIEGLLADIISVDAEYAPAIEAAIEGIGDSIVSTDSIKLLGDEYFTKELSGRIHFLCIDRIEPFTDAMDISGFEGVKGRLAEYIQTESKYQPLIWKLFGKAVLVDSIDSGLELAKRLPANYKFVTLKGEYVSPDGTIGLGSPGKSTGLISRKSRTKQLRKSVASLEQEIEAIEGENERLYQKQRHLDKLRQQLRTSTYEAKTEHLQISTKQTELERSIKRLSEEQPLITQQINSLESQIAEASKKEYESKQKLEELEHLNQQRSDRIEQLQESFGSKKRLQQSKIEALTELKVAAGQTAEQNRSLKQLIVSLQKQLEENVNNLNYTQSEINVLAGQEKEIQREILSCEAQVSRLYLEKQNWQQKSRSLHKKLQELLEEQQKLGRVVKEKRVRQQQIEEKLSELKVESAQLETKLQGLSQRAAEQYQIDLAASYENYTQHEVDWENVRREIEELRGRIERLGNVNLDAIDEQEGLEQRSDFLSEQTEDLNKSKSQLQQLIDRLNKKSRERFAQTFEEVRMHFQQIFRKLFGGGKADIVLQDSEDILEAGIEIIARPPGKQTRSISLLSGGEKALTAIALLFAVFKAKPSPFCFLDEIDAALDEANNERFNNLLREFQKDSQFIVITHSKRTMSIAQLLYGITMQRLGISKKISVRFDHYEPQTETAAVA